LSTTRLEALTEGACEAEARLCIELAVAAGKIDAAKATPVLTARYNGLAKVGVEGVARPPDDWLTSLRDLYELAVEAQTRLGR
jgi:hypothetical protein